MFTRFYFDMLHFEDTHPYLVAVVIIVPLLAMAWRVRRNG